MKRLSLFWRVLPIYALIVGVIFWHFWNQHQARQRIQVVAHAAQVQLAAAPKPVVTPKFEGKPTRLVIPRLVIDIPVEDGRYLSASRTWTVSRSSGNYATNTMPANNTAGQTLIYGHWFDAVLGKTRGLAPGDIAYVYTDTGHLFAYKYTGDTLLQPTDTQLFDHPDSGAPSLKLMTCSGTWAQNRRLMSFNLVSAA